MAGQLGSDELRIATGLRKSGMNSVGAALITAMVTRRHDRPRVELVHILRQYQGLEDPHAVDQEIQTLLDEGLLIRHAVNGRELIRCAAEAPEEIRSRIDDPQAQVLVTRLAAAQDSGVAILGAIDTPFVYGTYEDVLRGAQHNIYWPMVATSPNLESVAILKERARAGVKVRVLIASTELAVQLRGEAMRQTSIESMRGWRSVSEDIPSIEVRTVTESQHLLFPSSTLIDNVMLRLNIHDPGRQRSTDGTMLQVSCRDGLRPNLLSMTELLFENAWKDARPFKAIPIIGWWMRARWNWAGFILLTLAAATLGATLGQIYVAITTSVAATFLVNALVGDLPKVRQRLRQSRWTRG